MKYLVILITTLFAYVLYLGVYSIIVYDCSMTIEENDEYFYNRYILLDTAKYNLKTYIKQYPILDSIYKQQCILLKDNKRVTLAAKRLGVTEKELISYMTNNLIFPYHFYLIFWSESSYKLEKEGTYIGLGQINKPFIRECGYTLNEYNDNWKIQVNVAHYYFLKYTPDNPQQIENVYAKWLRANWNGTYSIYSKKDNPKEYKSNIGLDIDKNNIIDIDDLKQRFKKWN